MEIVTHRVDVHHHILPDDYVETLAALGITGGGDVPFPKWSAESTLVDPSHILFGSDWPFLPEALSVEQIEGLNGFRPFDATARASIERDNALRSSPDCAAQSGMPLRRLQ